MLVGLSEIGFDTAAPGGLSIPQFGMRLPDAVCVRTMDGGSFEPVTRRLGILHAFGRLGVLVSNDARAIENCVDKSMTSFLLARAGLPSPRSWAVESRSAGRGDRRLGKPAAGAEAALRRTGQGAEADRDGRGPASPRQDRRRCLLPPALCRLRRRGPLDRLPDPRLRRPRRRRDAARGAELDHQHQAGRDRPADAARRRARGSRRRRGRGDRRGLLRRRSAARPGRAGAGDRGELHARLDRPARRRPASTSPTIRARDLLAAVEARRRRAGEPAALPALA